MSWLRPPLPPNSIPLPLQAPPHRPPSAPAAQAITQYTTKQRSQQGQPTIQTYMLVFEYPPPTPPTHPHAYMPSSHALHACAVRAGPGGTVGHQAIATNHQQVKPKVHNHVELWIPTHLSTPHHQYLVQFCPLPPPRLPRSARHPTLPPSPHPQTPATSLNNTAGCWTLPPPPPTPPGHDCSQQLCGVSRLNVQGQFTQLLAALMSHTYSVGIQRHTFSPNNAVHVEVHTDACCLEPPCIAAPGRSPWLLTPL